MNEMKEDNIYEWVENLDTTKIKDSNKYKKRHIIVESLHNFLFEIEYWIRQYILNPFLSFKKGLINLWKWRKIIWRDRWWDYYFLLEILRFKLEDMYENWGNNTHYVDDYKEKDLIKDLLDDLNWLINDENEFKDGYADEYKKRSKRFFSKLDRNHRKLWD